MNRCCNRDHLDQTCSDPCADTATQVEPASFSEDAILYDLGEFRRIRDRLNRKVQALHDQQQMHLMKAAEEKNAAERSNSIAGYITQQMNEDLPPGDPDRKGIFGT